MNKKKILICIYKILSKFYTFIFGRKKLQSINHLFFSLTLDAKGFKNYGNFTKTGESNFINLIKNDINLSLDIGANVGKYTKLLLEKTNSNVISFEPLPEAFNELKKIELYCKGGKKISTEYLSKLTNLIENHSISELVDNCLAKEPKKISNILNENNFSNEDCILIIRTFLNKSKKILILSNDFNKNKNIEKTISAAKPPIFWKDKEITRKQIMLWKPENLKKLIYKLNDIELQIKKNLSNSLQVVTDFILEIPLTDPNN